MRTIAILACGLLSASILAETVIVEPTKDNTLYESSQGALSNGAGDFLFAGQTVNFGARRAVIAFEDLSVIPAGATINSVRLHVYVSREDSAATAVRLFRLVSDWGEGNSNAGSPGGDGTAAMTGDATWTHTFFDNMLWDSPGGDFASTQSAQTMVGDVGPYTFGSTDAMVADVQGWLDNPEGNFGWILIANENAKSARRLNSRESNNMDRRPMLEIEYSIDGSGAPSDWSGPWADFTLLGEGFLVYNTPVGWLIYFFGYSADGDRLWLVSNIVAIDNVEFGMEYEFPMLVGEPGSFDMPTHSDDLTSWGTLQVVLSDCVTGVFTLDGIDGVKVSNVQKVIGVTGTTCSE